MRLFFICLLVLPSFFTYAQFEEQDRWEKNKDWTNPYDSGYFRATDPNQLRKILQEVKSKQNARLTYSPVFNSFTERGPSNCPGRVNNVLIDDVNNIYLAAASTGGLWKFIPDKRVLSETNDNTTQWTKINDFELSLSISDICQDPFDYTTIYYSTGDSRIGKGAGIFKSTNGGQTFNQLVASTPDDLTNEFGQIYSMSMHPTRQNEFYVGTRSKVYRSKDGGASFAEVLSTDFYANGAWSICYASDGSVVVSMNSKGVYKSTTGDAGTFNLISSGIYSTQSNSDYFYIKIANCQSQRDVMYAQISGTYAESYLKGLYKSTDGGSNWTQISDPKNLIYYDSYFYSFMLSVKPTDPNFIITGGVNFAYTTDGGTTWKSAYNIGVDHNSAVWEKGSNSVYTTCDQGVTFFKSDVDIDQWGNRNDMGNGGLVNAQCYHGDYFPTGDGFLHGAQDNQCWVIGDSKNEGDNFTGGDGFACYTHKQNSMIGYGCSQSGRLVRCDSLFPILNPYPSNHQTTILNNLDANNDESPDEGHGFYTYFYVSSYNSDVLLFGTRKKIWLSKNKGDLWTPVTNDLNPTYAFKYAMTEEPSPTLYFAKDDQLYKTTDLLNAQQGDEQLLNISFPPAGGTIFELDPDNNDIIYTTDIFGDKLYKISGITGASPVSTDITGNLPKAGINDIAVLPGGNSSTIFLSSDIGLFYTSDGGTSWTFVEEFPYVKVNEIKFRPSDKKLFIFTWGRGTWIADLSSTLLGVNYPSNVSKNTSVVYPVPSINNIYIKDNNMSDILIIDMSGRTVKFLPSLENNVPIPISDLAEGVYVIKYHSNGNWKYATFIKK